MNMNKNIIIYVCLFFVSLGFVFIYFTQNKKIQNEVTEKFFLVLRAPVKNNNYTLDKCSSADCQTIDTISSFNSVDSLIVYDKNNILYTKNNKIVSRNFIYKTEKIIFNFPENYTLINSLISSGDYVAWVSFDGAYKYSNILNLKNNIYWSKKLDFILADDQVTLHLDKGGNSDKLILDVLNNVQESTIWLVYRDVENKVGYKLVEDGPGVFNITQADNKVFFYGDGKIYKINLDSGKKEEIYNWIGNDCYKSDISNNGQWLVENINNTSGSTDKYLLNFTNGEKSLIEKGVSCGFYNDSKWLGDRYYLENRLGYYLLFDIKTQATQKFFLANHGKSLIDAVIY